MLVPFAALLALAVPSQMPQSADATAAPSTVRIKLTAEGIGVQVYHCVAHTDVFQWELIEPQATLFDRVTHQPVGMHSAGPTWTWSDGSTITGKVAQKQPSTDTANIPWLLLDATASGGTQGSLTGVTRVRRSNTQGGVAPAASCNAQNLNVVLKVPYQATYEFYEPAH
jgi:hypothetical protein